MADYILGIESSCDDTSAAVLRDGFLLSNVIASPQVHKDFGGVPMNRTSSLSSARPWTRPASRHRILLR